MTNVWDYINNICTSDTNLMRDTENDTLAEKGYDCYLTNRSLSYHKDTVILSNMVNQWSHIDKRPQYEFYKSTVRHKKRFAKWLKPESNDIINILIEKYKCNRSIAEQYSSLLSDEQKDNLKKNNNKGG